MDLLALVILLMAMVLICIWATFRDPDGDVLICDDESLLEAWYEFEVDTS